MTEYRRTYPSGGALALFRYDRVEGRDAATGERLWGLETTFAGRPAANGESWFFGVQRPGSNDPAVNAYNLTTGRRRWASDDLSRGLPHSAFPRPTFGGTRPAADDGGVVALLRGWFPDDAAERPPRATDVAVTHLDAATGSVRWRTRLPDRAPTEELLAALLPQHVVAHNGAETVGIARDTGRVAWRVPSPLAAELEPLSADRAAVLARSSGGWSLTAYEAATGTRAWTCGLAAEGQERALAVQKDRIAAQFEKAGLAGEPHAGTVALIDGASGRLLWSVTPDAALSRQVSWPIGVAFLPDGRVAAGYQSTGPSTWTVFLLDPTTGETVWQRRLKDALQEVVVTGAGLLLLHESGYGHGHDRLTAVIPPSGS